MKSGWWSALVLVGAILVSIGTFVLMAWGWGFTHLDVGLLGLVGFFASLDLADILFRLHLRRRNNEEGSASPRGLTSVPLDVGSFTPVQIRHHLKPYAVIASLHNAEAILDDFIEAIEPFRAHLWVIDDASTDETAARLERAGVRCLRGKVNRKKPGAVRDLLATLDPDITTVVVLDPDSRFLDSGTSTLPDLENVIFDFQQSRMAAVCPCLTIRESGLLERMQQLEYWLSFNFGRRSLYDHSITSGIAIYRRDALVRVLEASSSVYAEDLKNAYLLLAAGERIYYDGRLVIETAGKDTWPGWFSQRVGWYFGLIKVYLESLPEIRRWGTRGFLVWYHFVFYTGLVAIALHPVRMAALVLLCASILSAGLQMVGLGRSLQGHLVDPAYFVLTYVQSTIMVLVALASASAGERRPLWMRILPVIPLYFFYALAHIVPISVGYANYFTLRLFGRRIYRDHFQDDASLRRELLGAES